MDLVQSLSGQAQTASSNSTLSEIFTMHECLYCLFMFIQETKQLKAEGTVWFEELGLANHYN